jgi:hypothetical protein
MAGPFTPSWPRSCSSAYRVAISSPVMLQQCNSRSAVNSPDLAAAATLRAWNSLCSRDDVLLQRLLEAWSASSSTSDEQLGVHGSYHPYVTHPRRHARGRAPTHRNSGTTQQKC